MSEHDVRKVAEAIIDESRKGVCGGCGATINESLLAYNIAAALAAERAKWEAVANYEELARCPKALGLMIAGVVDQCGKGQWFNVTHRLHEVQSEVATRLQRAVNGDPAHMSPDRIGGWGFRDDRVSAATSALDTPPNTSNSTTP